MSDFSITLAIDRHLLSDEGVFSHLIDVTTENGIVMLTGTVDHLLAKEQATKIAAYIKGVRAVVNNLEVKSPLPLDRPFIQEELVLADSQIRQYVQQALQTDPAVQADQVEVAVKTATLPYAPGRLYRQSQETVHQDAAAMIRSHWVDDHFSNRCIKTLISREESALLTQVAICA